MNYSSSTALSNISSGAVKRVTGATVITDNDGIRFLFIDNTAGVDIDIEVPLAANNIGRKISFIRVDTNLDERVRIYAPGGNLDTNTRIDLRTKFGCLNIVSDGVEWLSTANHYLGVKNISTSSSSVLESDRCHSYFVTTGNTNTVLTLAPNASRAFFVFHVKKVDDGTGKVIITPTHSQLLDGATTRELVGQGSSAIIASTGSGWETVANAASQNNVLLSEKSSSYTITNIDGIRTLVLDNTSGGNILITLPSASANPNRIISFVRVDDNFGDRVEIEDTITANIDNLGAKIELNARNDSTTLQSTGTFWRTLSNERLSTKNINGDNTTIDMLDRFHAWHVTTGAGNRTITLPNVDDNIGFVIYAKKVDNGVGKLILNPASSQLIDGALTKELLNEGDSVIILSDGTQWNTYSSTEQGFQNPWRSKIINTTALTSTNGDQNFVDTTGGAITNSLPASPQLGDRVRYLDAKDNASTNNITVDRNSSNINGAASNFIISTNGQTVEFVYMDVTEGWRTIVSA